MNPWGLECCLIRAVRVGRRLQMCFTCSLHEAISHSRCAPSSCPLSSRTKQCYKFWTASYHPGPHYLVPGLGLVVDLLECLFTILTEVAVLKVKHLQCSVSNENQCDSLLQTNHIIPFLALNIQLCPVLSFTITRAAVGRSTKL